MSEVPHGPGRGPVGEPIRAQLSRLERLLGFELDPQHLPAWLRRTRGEHRVPAALAILALIALQMTLRSDLVFQPWYLMPTLEISLLIVLLLANPTRITRESALLRVIGLSLVAIASIATLWSVLRLARGLVTGSVGGDAVEVLISAAAVWFTNVIVAALWYWEFDRGGPAARANGRNPYPDFLFPQMTAPELAKPDWEPTFPDYLYLSFTNTTAFSPTDTLPLSRWAKMAMMVQSAGSLMLVALVIARAVNTLR
jgi:uncharacterized membrane protein